MSYNIIEINPSKVKYIEADKAAKLLTSKNYVAELKEDGVRGTMHFYADGVRLFTRGLYTSGPMAGKPIEITHRWPRLQTMGLDKIPIGTILDGEIYSPIRTAAELAGILNYRSTAEEAPMDVRFVGFDALFYGYENDLRSLPWVERRRMLHLIVESLQLPIQNFVTTSVIEFNDKVGFYNNIIATGGEGVVLKRMDAPYVEGKSNPHWLKLKKFEDYDCFILGFKEGTGRNKGKVGSIILGQYKPISDEGDGVLYVPVEVCSVKCQNDEMRDIISLNPSEYIGRIIELRGYGRHESGAIREPRVMRMREVGEKPVEECIMEGF